MNNQQKTVLLLFGGESSEHTVSISSARNVFAAIDNTKYDVALGFIDQSGKWWRLNSFDEYANTTGFEQLLPILGEKSFKCSISDEIIKPDVILPILHGKNGEDGTVQSLAELLHIPIVGCGVTSSAICMDKVIAKQIAQQNNIPVVDYAIHRAFEPTPDWNELKSLLGEVVFVKPVRAGSSVGASPASDAESFRVALDLAHQHDDVVLIERNIVARELEVAVLGNSPNHKISGVGEIKPDGDFYSYESKYDESSKSEIILSANIGDELSEQIRGYARDLFTFFGCRGLSRIDFFLDANGQVYFNEINTLPGFTNISMYPKLFMEQGMTYSEIIEKMITLAL